MLKGKKILIGITGSIAAYKIPFLVRFLIKEGAEVKVIATEAARDFVTPLTLSTLSGHPVLSAFFDAADGSWNSHIELGYWADAYVIAPVSANTMGKMVNGLADNLLVATYLAAKCPVFFAPAMDVDMYNHPSTQENIQKLQQFGNHLIEPESGELASGLTGAGRMQEPESILAHLTAFFQKKKAFDKLNVLVTAGPTYEPIDPVRFVGNFSSGRMGFAIAEAFAAEGASVRLVAGPVSLNTVHKSVALTRVQTAAEMFRAVKDNASDANIIVMAAAVADYAPVDPPDHKMKKQAGNLKLELQPTQDILKHLGATKKPGQFLVGFALETDHEIENARKKLKNKNLDLIVLNSLQDEGAGFGHATNKVTFIRRNGETTAGALKDKSMIARDILKEVKMLMNQ